MDGYELKRGPPEERPFCKDCIILNQRDDYKEALECIVLNEWPQMARQGMVPLKKADAQRFLEVLFRIVNIAEAVLCMPKQEAPPAEVKDSTQESK